MKNHRHLGVYGIIIKNNKILLIKKSRGAYIGKLDLPGGGLEHGEDIIQCLKREIKEETGLDIKKTELRNVYTYNIEWDNNGEIENLHHIGIIYDVILDNFTNLKLDGDGLDSLGTCWINISETNFNLLSPFAYKVMAELICVKK